MRLIWFVPLLLISTAHAATHESFRLKTPRGTELVGLTTFPDRGSDAEGPRMTVVLAPGQGYHMQRPILAELAESLAQRGIAVFRFNWSYYTADPEKGEPAADLGTEREDLETVLAFVQRDPRVDPAQIVLAGKSLGTIVAYSIFQHTPSLKGLLLMTPVCTSLWDGNDNELPAPVSAAAENYPALAQTSRPVVFVPGNADPLCSLPMLYDYLRDTCANVSTVVVGGDHSWNLGPWNDPAYSARNGANVSQAVSMVSYWISLILGH